MRYYAWSRLESDLGAEGVVWKCEGLDNLGCNLVIVLAMTPIIRPTAGISRWFEHSCVSCAGRSIVVVALATSVLIICQNSLRGKFFASRGR